MPYRHTVIIGAGPAGLAIAAHLRERQLPFTIVEKARTVASSWRNHYDRLHLHTARKFSALPFLPLPETYPEFASRQQVVDYAEQYADHFNIEPVFEKTVARVSRPSGPWVVSFADGDKWSADNIVLATGTNAVPKIPAFEGQAVFQGQIVHSKDYRNPSPFKARKVLVIGMGNTGAEIALDLVNHNVEADISVRNPVNIVPLRTLGRPTQATAVRIKTLPHALQDFVGRLAQRLFIGDLTDYGLATPSMAPTEQLRKMGKSPTIDVGTVKLIKSGKIRIRPEVRQLINDGVVFSNGDTVEYDIILLATGYRSTIRELVPAASGILDQAGNPQQVIGTGKLGGLYFLGFDNYQPGGILGIINTDSKKIAEHIAAK